MLMFAVLARERGCLFRLLLMPFLFCFVMAHGSAASAASLNVKIRQLNPAGEVQQATCAVGTPCLVPVDIQTNQKKKETVNARIEFVPGNVLSEFKGPDGYLYAGDKADSDTQYETLWHAAVSPNKTSIYDVTLFLPAVPNADAAPILNAKYEAAHKTTHAAVADLEITMEQSP